MSPKQKRHRTDSASSADSKTKCRKERLLNLSRVGGYKGPAFVSEPDSISEGLVKIIASKACQATITVKDALIGGEDVAYGSGGWLLSLAKQDEAGDTVPQPAAKKAKTDTHVITPITAKHNICNADGMEYVRATMKFPELTGRNGVEVEFPEGGCTMTKHIQINQTHKTEDDDFTFGVQVSFPEEVFRKVMKFVSEKVPDEKKFEIDVGHKIGMAVYRNYDITPQDADAPASTDLENFYGKRECPCIYTGTVTEVSSNGKTFLHDINTFEGCSGALIFLLDVNQPSDFDPTLSGMVVGIHTSGVDMNNNVAFKLPRLSS